MKKAPEGKIRKALFLCLLITSVIMASVSLTHCKKDKEDNDFLIKVDSINIPDVLTAGIPFDIKFYGTIGYNDCVSFKTFNKTISGNEMRVSAWGTYDKNRSKCNDGLVILDGSFITVTISTPGYYEFYVEEPDNTIIHRQLAVK